MPEFSNQPLKVLIEALDPLNGAWRNILGNKQYYINPDCKGYTLEALNATSQLRGFVGSSKSTWKPTWSGLTVY